MAVPGRNLPAHISVILGAIGLMLASVVLTGCGQTGALYLPDAEQEAEAPSAQAPASARDGAHED